MFRIIQRLQLNRIINAKFRINKQISRNYSFTSITKIAQTNVNNFVKEQITNQITKKLDQIVPQKGEQIFEVPSQALASFDSSLILFCFKKVLLHYKDSKMMPAKIDNVDNITSISIDLIDAHSILHTHTLKIDKTNIDKTQMIKFVYIHV